MKTKAIVDSVVMEITTKLMFHKCKLLNIISISIKTFHPKYFPGHDFSIPWVFRTRDIVISIQN